MVYVLLTLTSVIALLIADMPTFDSVALAMSSISTGGFTVRNGSLETYNNAAAEYVLMVTMFLGASSFIWLRYLLDRNWQQAALHRETYVLAGLVVLLGLGIGTSLAASSGSVATLHPLTALREGLFHAVSLMSTTGLESRAAGLLLVPPPLIIILIVVGGASFSTSGGLQIFRVGAMLLQSVRELNRLLYPHSVQRFRLGTENYTIQTMKTIWSLALVFGLTLAVGLVGLSLQLPSFEMALMAATALLTNSGPVYSSAAAIDPNWLPYADFSTPSKVMSMALMILGRVQTLVLLGALSVFIFKDGLWRPASHFSSNRQERT
jgi:trk system potassium uptake protein TrkH